MFFYSLIFCLLFQDRKSECVFLKQLLLKKYGIILFIPLKNLAYLKFSNPKTWPFGSNLRKIFFTF